MLQVIDSAKKQIDQYQNIIMTIEHPVDGIRRKWAGLTDSSFRLIAGKGGKVPKEKRAEGEKAEVQLCLKASKLVKFKGEKILPSRAIDSIPLDAFQTV